MLESTAFIIGNVLTKELEKTVLPLEGLVIGFKDSTEAIDKFVSSNKLKTSVDDIITQFDNLNLTFEAASKPGQNQEDRLKILDAMPTPLNKKFAMSNKSKLINNSR